jgi:hypothetical protein
VSAAVLAELVAVVRIERGMNGTSMQRLEGEEDERL